ncbi:hypothetical protein TNCV_293181 [Trichonephila clavipes]|nr:hypothetical protein TNCV_293181 [Trichonephila clavipes]
MESSECSASKKSSREVGCKERGRETSKSILPQNWSETAPKRTVSCKVLKAVAKATDVFYPLGYDKCLKKK